MINMRTFPFLDVSLLIAASVALGAAPAKQLTLYVAPGGNDSWSGRLAVPDHGDGPLATLDGARDAIRNLKKLGGLPPGGITVELRGGVYQLAHPFTLQAEDSGAEGSPIVYRASHGETVRLVGGVPIELAPVVDPTVLERLDASARGHVLQADLRAAGVTDLGQPAGDANRLELFYNDRPMTLARWPNEGFVRIVDLVGGAPVDVRGTKGDKIGRFFYEGDRPKRWAAENDMWLHGYWFWDWADQRQKVASIDTAKRIITLAPPYHGYGYRKGQWYYAFNALCELDAPGEWYLDRQSGILYFCPPDAGKGRAVVSVLPALVVLDGAAHVAFRSLTLEACRGTAIRIRHADDNHVIGCTIRNAGCWAVEISGARSGVAGCDIYQTGDGGVALQGGDRPSLTPGRLYAANNHIHHYGRWNRMYQPAVSVQGVGNRVAHNLMSNAPHQAIAFGGNDHTIEYNEIHSVCYESNDAGAIYAGRNWTMRGTVIRHNYFHDISGFRGGGCVGVYLDDQFSGTEIVGNVFYRVTRAAMIGGGRDCTIVNNIFVDCLPATHVDSRGLGWAAPGRPEMERGLKDVPYQSPLWAKRYPRLPGILREDPMAPRGNLIARNFCVGGRWGDFDNKALPLVDFQHNLVDKDPRFVDAAQHDFRLRDDSPAWAIGFQRIPVEKIGLVNDGHRASWPVVDSIRPLETPPK
jgi:hypothetical protein